MQETERGMDEVACLPGFVFIFILHPRLASNTRCLPRWGNREDQVMKSMMMVLSSVFMFLDLMASPVRGDMINSDCRGLGTNLT